MGSFAPMGGGPHGARLMCGDRRISWRIVGFLGESAELPEPTAPASELAEAEGPLLVAENHRRSEIPHLGEAAEEVALYIHRSYRVPIQDARQLTEWALEIGEAENMDPLLILAVAGSESSFDPAARSKAGAEGLMQVMTKVHEDKFEPFGGKTAAFDPYSNMRVGAQILRQLIARTGSVTKALKWYSGAANHSTDWGYSAKVLREHRAKGTCRQSRDGVYVADRAYDLLACYDYSCPYRRQSYLRKTH